VKVIHGDMGETDSFYFYRNSEGTELGPLADDEIEEPIR
jgi:hypothetical protein